MVGRPPYRPAANAGQAGDWFGYSVAIDGSLAAVAAYHADAAGEGNGATFVFEYSDGSWFDS